MLITIDIGNTNIGLAIFAGSRLMREFRLPTRTETTVDEMALQFAGLIAASGLTGPWTGVAIASVVPVLDRVATQAASECFQAPVLLLSPEMRLPVKNGYRPPAAVGMDRLVNAVAARAEFGAPVIVADFGTATTVDAVSARNIYLGGAILPGMHLAADALARRTALLPRVDIQSAGRALGRTTEESLRSGIVLGAAGAVSFLIAGIQRELGARTPVVATGGLVEWVAPHCPGLKHHRPHLTHAGLRLCWEHMKKTGRKKT